MMRPDAITPVELTAWQDELIQYATGQVREIFEATPSVCLFLLDQSAQLAALPLVEQLDEFLDRMILDHPSPAMDAMAELLPWVDSHALAAWLVEQTQQHKERLIADYRRRIAAAYLALCQQRHGTPSFIHQHTGLSLSAELVALAIAEHLEGAVMEDRGQQAGPDACLALLGAMLTQDGQALTLLGATVMDELFRSLVEDYQRNGQPTTPVKH